MVDYPNGKIPASLLRPVSNFRPLTARVNENMGSNLLREDAWAALNMLQAAFYQALGRPLYVSEAYRGLTLQTAYWQDFQAGVGNLAAYPGTSKHGRAVSCDFGSGAGTYGSVAKDWLDANAPRFGWHPTGNGFKPREGWHFDFIPNTATEIIPASGGATPIQEDFLSDAQYQAIMDSLNFLGDRVGAIQIGLNAVGDTTRADLDNTNRLGEYARDAQLGINSLGNDLRAASKLVGEVQANVNVVGDQNRATQDKVGSVLTYVTESRRGIMAGLDNLGNVLTGMRGTINDTAALVKRVVTKTGA